MQMVRYKILYLTILGKLPLLPSHILVFLEARTMMPDWNKTIGARRVLMILRGKMCCWPDRLRENCMLKKTIHLRYWKALRFNGFQKLNPAYFFMILVRTFLEL